MVKFLGRRDPPPTRAGRNSRVASTPGPGWRQLDLPVVVVGRGDRSGGQLEGQARILIEQHHRGPCASAQLSLAVPGLCLGEAGVGAGKRCKCLIIKPLEPATTV